MLDLSPAWTLDFETYPIGPRPEHYPPKPCGLAVRWPDGRRDYLTDLGAIYAVLQEAWASDLPIIFHNAKFDLQVAMVHFDLPALPWQRVHDTMFLCFLMDPYGKQGLKPAAERLLSWPPDEKDEITEWIIANSARLPRFPFIKNSKGEPNGNPSKKNAGAWIAYAPVELTAKYAIGDVDRTWALKCALLPIIEDSGMLEHYNIERQVLWILIENEMTGVRVDTSRLSADVEMYQRALTYVEDWLRWRLNAPGLNLDADADVADVLQKCGIVTNFKKTATGKRSVSKKNLFPEDFHDQDVAQMLGYRNRCQTVLTKHMEPMLEQAVARGGYAMGSWNQVASDMGGTATGRPSMNDLNLLNVSKKFEGKDGFVHPSGQDALPHLPLVRRYILPDEGHVIIKRDFSGQELHVFGHFEHGELAARYAEDPDLDVHNFVGEKINAITGDTKWTHPDNRTALKVVNFQSIYGGGIPALQNELRWDHARAKEFKNFHNAALPGRQVLANTLSTIVRTGRCIRTYGGRLYARPPFKKDKSSGQLREKDYILINYLVQGSSSDITKRAMVRFVNAGGDARFMLQVYDEMNASSPIETAPENMMLLKESMEGIPLRTSLPTDGEWGWNWGDMNKMKGDETEILRGLSNAA